MVTITTIAQRLLDENNYTLDDISATNFEYLIDNAIDYINMEAGTSIAALSGSVGSKSLVGSASENVAVKALSVLSLRQHIDRGPYASVGPGVVINSQTSDPQLRLQWMYVKRLIQRLRGRDFERV